MAQPIRQGVPAAHPSKMKVKKSKTGKRWHPKYGTSKLEDKFASEFLDRLGVDYVRQYEAKSIGRFYDFYIPSANALIEIDGDYYHGYGLVREDKSPMQKKNERVDRLKDEWALSHCIPIIRFWEHDINGNPQKVMAELKRTVGACTEKLKKKEEMQKRH